MFTNVLPITKTEIGAKFEVENVYYKVTANNEVAVTFEGDSYDAVQDEYCGEIVIPRTVTYNGTIYTVTSIDNYTFRGCNDITLLQLEATIPPVANENTFDGVDRSLPIYVLEGCAKTYITANYWKEFINIVESAILPYYCKFETNGIYYTVTAEKESVAVSLAGFSTEPDLEYYKGFRESVLKKLSNERFVNNAPAAVVEGERRKLADAETKIKNLEDSISALSK